MKPTPIPYLPEYIDRFMSYVSPEPMSGCWLWTGGVLQNGYGAFGYGGRSYSAQRVSYRLLVGDIAEDLFVCHKCDIKICVNPSHLFLGTTQDNTRDRHTKGRSAKGEIQGASKLTEKQVKYIKSVYRRGYRCKYNAVGLSKEFGVYPSTIESIIRGKSWKHI